MFVIKKKETKNVYNSLLLNYVDKEVSLGHQPSNKVGDKAPLVTWEPYYCVLLQDEQTFTAYRSEEMAVSYHFSIQICIFLCFTALFAGSLGIHLEKGRTAAPSLFAGGQRPFLSLLMVILYCVPCVSLLTFNGRVMNFHSSNPSIAIFFFFF